MHYSAASEAFENHHQAWERILLQHAAGRQLVCDLTQGPGATRLYERQQSLVDEEELPVAVAVAQGPEGFRAQRHGVVEPDAVASLQSMSLGSVDPAHAVDGDLTDQELAELLVAHLGAEVLLSLGQRGLGWGRWIADGRVGNAHAVSLRAR